MFYEKLSLFFFQIQFFHEFDFNSPRDKQPNKLRKHHMADETVQSLSMTNEFEKFPNTSRNSYVSFRSCNLDIFFVSNPLLRLYHIDIYMRTSPPNYATFAL